MSSSSQAPQYGDIIPRTTCPKAPEMLNVLGGAWEPAFAHATNHTMDVVPNYKEFMKLQPKFVTSDVSMAWALHEPFQAKGNPETLYPLVVYLHGGSEMASRQDELPFLDNRHAKSFFASAQSLLTPEHLEEKPAYIFAPFCDAKAPSGKKCAFGSAEWASNGFGAIGATLNGEGSPYGAAVEAIIEQLIATKQVDPARIYVTGPSMGGGGSWDLAGRRPDLIAAAIPLAGHPLTSNSLQTLADYKVPVWSHHGQKDNTNSYPAAQSAIASLASKGGCAWQTTYLPSQNLADDDPADADPSDATHNIWARVYTNPELWDWVFAQSQPRSGEVIVTPSSSSGGSSSSEGSDVVLAANNHYDAPKASVAPVIDSEIDAVWADAPWMRMDVAWTGFENLKVPGSAADFNGKYKAMWTEDHVYLLFDITDDIINTSGEHWQQDTVELFVDEDKSGGPHEQNHSAFAYHVSYTKKVVDSGGNIDGHIGVAIKTVGTRHIWEIKMEIYANHNGYVPAQQQAARVKLAAGKLMGFTPSYIDNDGRGREHFMSSVNTPGHQTNQGYINADGFGSIKLIE